MSLGLVIGDTPLRKSADRANLNNKCVLGESIACPPRLGAETKLSCTYHHVELSLVHANEGLCHLQRVVWRYAAGVHDANVLVGHSLVYAITREGNLKPITIISGSIYLGNTT